MLSHSLTEPPPIAIARLLRPSTSKVLGATWKRGMSFAPDSSSILLARVNVSTFLRTMSVAHCRSAAAIAISALVLGRTPIIIIGVIVSRNTISEIGTAPMQHTRANGGRFPTLDP
ncbi:hypothetical protein IQ07DRAFT_581678 [Pyrenochaeta sp. DS3sAY3a]|nr:hypothetical protein IQ07DRAFT_581678 [Pyrenochaeta sp. DS3sAY3a]